MPEHRSGTREEWLAAREELAQLEAEQAHRGVLDRLEVVLGARHDQQVAFACLPYVGASREPHPPA